jgi:hypothetical protein
VHGVHPSRHDGDGRTLIRMAERDLKKRTPDAESDWLNAPLSLQEPTPWRGCYGLESFSVIFIINYMESLRNGQVTLV